LDSKLKKIATYVLKAGIFVLVLWYCYKLLTRNDALTDFRDLVRGIQPIIFWICFFTVFVLMFINWFVEALKWRFLCMQFQPINIPKAVVSVFCGLSWAVFTPNRIGEYGGRVLFLRPRKRVFGVIAMLIGAISQMVITNVIGIAALCWFIGTYLDISSVAYLIICVFSLVYMTFFLLLYFNLNFINKWLLRFKFVLKFKRFFKLIFRYRSSYLRRVLVYSMVRYVVFTSQYCLLLQVLIPELPLFEMLIMIFILFFVQSALPSLDLFDVGVRSATASYFFGFITTQTVAVMAIAACIWFVNLIVPAIIGSFFNFKINFFNGRSN